MSANGDGAHDLAVNQRVDGPRVARDARAQQRVVRELDTLRRLGVVVVVERASAVGAAERQYAVVSDEQQQQARARATLTYLTTLSYLNTTELFDLDYKFSFQFLFNVTALRVMYGN